MNQTAQVEIETPFPDVFLPAVWKWIEPFRNRVFDDFCPQNREDFVQWHLGRSRIPGRTTFGIRRGGELGGLVTIERAAPGHPTALAHLLFRKSFWGRKTTEPALREIFARVFDSGVLSLRSEVFSDNHAIISLIESLGGVRYGIPRIDHGKAVVDPIPNSTIRGGEPLGMVGLILTPEGLTDAVSSAIRTADHRSSGGDRKRPAGTRRTEAGIDLQPELHARAGSAAKDADRAGDPATQQPTGNARLPGLPQPSGHERKPGDG